MESLDGEDFTFSRSTDNIPKSGKRKFDEDGFIQPNTPDNSTSCHQNTEGEIEKYTGGGTNFFQGLDENFNTAPTESVSVYFQEGLGEENKGDNFVQRSDTNFEQYTQIGDAHLYNGNDGDFTVDNAYVSKSEEAFNTTSYDATNRLPNQEGAASQQDSENILEGLFKDFEQEASMVFAEWSKTFSQCGSYELKCQQKLDDLLGNANSIEETLNSKKDFLCSRLKGVGKTLEM